MAESQTVIERLFEYLKAVGMSPSGLEKKAGLANGYLRNSKGGIGAQKLSEIFDACEDLNPTWLMTGKGEMIVAAPTEADSEDAHVDSPEHVDYAKVGGAVGLGLLSAAGLATIAPTGLAASIAAIIGGATYAGAKAISSEKPTIESSINTADKNAPKCEPTSEQVKSVLGQLVSTVQNLQEEVLGLYRLNSEKDAKILALQAQIAQQTTLMHA